LKLLSDKISNEEDSLGVLIIPHAYSEDDLDPTEISTRFIRERQ